MTGRKDHLKLRLGAIFLALATMAAVVFGIINFQQRLLFNVPDDGVSWIDSPLGIQAFTCHAADLLTFKGKHRRHTPVTIVLHVNGNSPWLVKTPSLRLKQFPLRK